MLPSRHLTANCSSALTRAFGASRAPGKTTVSNHSHSHSTLVAATAKGGVQLDIANSVWPQREDGFRQDFLDLLKTDYGAIVTPSDFIREHERARAAINRWVEEKTHKKISDMAEPEDIDSLTRLVIANAIYFKGFWATQFPESATRTGTFIVNANLSVSVPFMMVTGDFGCYEDAFLQCLILPYREKQFQMVLLLPRSRGKEGWFGEAHGPDQKARDPKRNFIALEDNLNPARLRTWISRAMMMEVHVMIPKFKLSNRIVLSSVLEALGVVDAFNSRRADFSGIVENAGPLFLSKFLHRASIEVDEKGTEAVATSAAFAKRAGTIDFLADHPF